MQYLAVFACLVAAASASGHMYSNGIMGNNMNQFGQMMNQGWNTGYHQGGGNMMQQLLHGHMGNQQQWGGQMYGGQMHGGQMHGGNQQNGMNNNLLGSLLGNMLGSLLMNNMRGNMGWQQPVEDAASEEMKQMQELMKMSMAQEMFDVMRAYNKFKDDEEEFGKAMYHLCMMVNATWAASRQYNFEVFNKTTDESVAEMERQSMGMTEAEKMEGTVWVLMNDPKTFEELFFRMATWSCWAGHAYLESSMKLDKMTRGEKCDH